ncbi:ATP-dependent endonuclease [Alkalihalobacillus sp. AL-G]|uniref:ATP-dependent nuclease n=1 Tax=Alkalihalobacillus sp. AL-G TaxID=2926399 RepID=UPI00272C54D6|nr:AAA family ATPase [Alkalihalobacillus sp. AL-G]WLD93784.1 AAA family ATPase [Alkalihalobacillus sp. AL-G]
MITKLSLKFGATSESENLEISTTPVTVFVGPNNSGKSKLLREIFNFCREGRISTNDVILEDVEFTQTDEEFGKKALSQLLQKPTPQQTIPPGNVIIGNFSDKVQVNEQDFLNIFNDSNRRKQDFCRTFLRFNSLFLDGQNRMQLIKDQQAGDLQTPPQNSLSLLFRDDERRKEVRRILYDAFKRYFVIDPTNLGTLKMKFSDIEPESDMLERGIHKEAVEFHSRGDDIKNLSDGVKAFTGIITQIVAGDPLALMIDEPEAFLHPSLSFKLGKEISLSAANSNKNIFVATHSANFIMGCIQSGVPVNIVRLTYLHGVPTARLLPSDSILKLMRNPLLRSTGVIEGIFYESLIVTESDSDRAFYQEINERLLKYTDGLGIPNCLFINAQNKQTVHQIIKPLRELGIPAATIVDIDVLKEGGSVWTNFLIGGFVPDISHESLGNLRNLVNRRFNELNINMKTKGGISALPRDDREGADNLLNQLKEYGLFVIKNGELESWLSELEVTGHGSKWLIEVFEKMGENPDLDEYLKPTERDVWKFLESIGDWLLNPNRKGIPST